MTLLQGKVSKREQDNAVTYGCLKDVSLSDQQQNKGLFFNFELAPILDKAYPSLNIQNFTTQILSIFDKFLRGIATTFIIFVTCYQDSPVTMWRQAAKWPPKIGLLPPCLRKYTVIHCNFVDHCFDASYYTRLPPTSKHFGDAYFENFTFWKGAL